jgi:exosome complex exonuclease DIS3/RRP44
VRVCCVFAFLCIVQLQAQDRLDDMSDGTPLGSTIKLLASVARHLRKQRIVAGALTLASAEVKVSLNENHDPLDVKAYEIRESNSMVEEVRV